MHYIYTLYMYILYILYMYYIYIHYIYTVYVLYNLYIYIYYIYIYIIPMSITSEDSHVWLRPTLHPGGLHVGPAIPPSGRTGTLFWDGIFEDDLSDFQHQ